jgi:uncharacterized protein YbjT (DUF2867 family)
MSNKTALVIRATGSQGKGVTKALLKAGWSVHALVTDPTQPRALALQDLGASLHKGALDDPKSLKSAIEGCNAVFLTQIPSFAGDNAEVRDATSVLELAKQAGVQHIVHSTSLGLNDPDISSKVADMVVAPAITGKLEVEKLVQASGMPWTILRPGYFMTNLTAPLVNYMFPDLLQGHFISSYQSDTVLPHVDPEDVGVFAAAAFKDPGKFGGKIVSVVGDMKSVADTIHNLSRAVGKEIRVTYRTEEETKKELKENNPMTAGQVITNDLSKWVDMDEVRNWGLPLTSFSAFLEKNKESVPSF